MRGVHVTSVSVRPRLIAGLALVMIVIASTAILAQRGKQRTALRENRISSPVPAATKVTPESVSPDELTSSSLWSKEYIHGAGGKVIATEERALFTDVTAGPFLDEIYRIAARGVTRGCLAVPLRFCPDDSVTRGQMAAFIMRALGEFNPPTPPSQRFGDVLPNNDFYNFIDRLAVLGITVGCGDGNYCPNQAVTHEQMAAFIMRARNEFNPPTPPTQRFNDVPPSNQFYNFIERMGFLHIWDGCGSNNYCPTDPVTRRQMAHILVKGFGI